MKTFSAYALGIVLVVGGAFALNHFYPSSNGPVAVEGSISGPDASYPCYSYNGATTCYNRKPLNTASTTICAIQSPTATSSLEATGGVQEFISSTTASTIIIAKSATPFATTTQIGTSISVAAGAQVSATTSAFIFGPNTWFVVSQQGGTGTFSPNGTCQANFKVL